MYVIRAYKELVYPIWYLNDRGWNQMYTKSNEIFFLSKTRGFSTKLIARIYLKTLIADNEYSWKFSIIHLPET